MASPTSNPTTAQSEVESPGNSSPGRPGNHVESPAWQADRSLVRSARAGDSEALANLVHRLRCVPAFLEALNKHAGHYLQHHDLKDLKQDALLVVWKKLDTFEGRSELSTWAYNICRYEFLNQVRRVSGQSKRQAANSEQALEQVAKLEESAPHTLDLEVELDRMAEDDSRVLRLKHFEGLELREIADRLQVSLSKAKRLYYGARERLLLRLKGAGEIQPS